MYFAFRNSSNPIWYSVGSEYSPSLSSLVRVKYVICTYCL